jgi:hypothetical protein
MQPPAVVDDIVQLVFEEQLLSTTLPTSPEFVVRALCPNVSGHRPLTINKILKKLHVGIIGMGFAD